MAGSRRRTGKKNQRRFIIAIPIIAVVALAGVYALSLIPPARVSLAQNFAFEMSIQYSNGTRIRFAVPPAVGESQTVGGTAAVWLSSRYNGNGMDNLHYPIYIDPPPQPYPGFSVVHVASRVAVNYTLGDLFDVWGQPLSQNRTLNVPSTSSYGWNMCAGFTKASLQPGLWKAQPLVPGLNIVLLYSRGTCATAGSVTQSPLGL